MIRGRFFSSISMMSLAETLAQAFELWSQAREVLQSIKHRCHKRSDALTPRYPVNAVEVSNAGGRDTSSHPPPMMGRGQPPPRDYDQQWGVSGLFHANGQHLSNSALGMDLLAHSLHSQPSHQVCWLQRLNTQRICSMCYFVWHLCTAWLNTWKMFPSQLLPPGQSSIEDASTARCSCMHWLKMSI